MWISLKVYLNFIKLYSYYSTSCWCSSSSIWLYFQKDFEDIERKQKKSYLILKAIMLNATMYHIPVISFEVTGFYYS